MAIKTDEEIIRIAKEYLASTKLATRHGLRKATGTSMERVEQLARDGHFALPPKVSPKVKHLYSKSTWHDNFKLPNSH